MSTIKVDTIKNTSNVEVFTAKAWVNFNGSGTVAIRASGNVSSITDNGTGDYTVNFTTAMADTNYIISANSTFDGGGWTGQANAQPKADVTRSTSATRIVTSNTVNAVLYDHSLVYIAVFR
jgi:hypothetical protein